MNCSHCGSKTVYILVANNLWCEECFTAGMKAYLENHSSENYEEFMKGLYELKGMKEAGWKETKMGNYYYKDD